MNVLFLTLGKIESINTQGMYNDLLRNFKENGHNVYIVSPREKRLRKLTEYVSIEGINILKVKIGNLTKTNVIEKGISTIKIEKQFLKAIKKHIKDVKFDLILYSTPPITFNKVIQYIKKKDSAKSYLLLKDIFPQNALDLNMLSKKNPIYWYFRSKEKKLYKNSDHIGCMSKENMNYLMKKNSVIPNNIIEVNPNSIDPIKRERDLFSLESIRKKHNIPINKTVFIYGGNLGKPQGINFLIECLRANKYNEEVFFVIAGSGTEVKKLEKHLSKEKITNVILFPQLPKNEYELLVTSCDVGLLFLDNRFTIPNFPSRILSYMQASMPVLAATDISTDIRQIIELGEFGLWCESKTSELKCFNNKVNLLCDSKLREEMGINARNYLEENYTAKRSYEIIMKHFE